MLDVRGEWFVNGNRAAKLSKGSSVYVGAVITAASPSDSGSYIVIANRSGEIAERRVCRNGDECRNPIRLPSTVRTDRSYVAKAFEMVRIMMRRQPAKYATFIPRGGSDLQEAVLKLDAQKLDLSQVFRNMPGDRYFVRFEKIDKGLAGGAKPLELEFDWDSQKPAPLGAKGLGPGLYRVSVREVSLLAPEEGESPGSEAWVLVTTPNGYAKAAPSFNAMLNMTRRWGDSVRQNSVRQYLRATLEFLMTQNQR